MNKEEKTEEAAPEAPKFDGILLVRKLDEQGNATVDLQGVGDVKITEFDTILRLGLKQLRIKLDLN